MFHPIDKWNVPLENALDVDLNITRSQNIQSKYVLMRKVIIHATTTKIMVTTRYRHLWHECLAMTNVQVEILVTVRNEPIGFWILEQCAT